MKTVGFIGLGRMGTPVARNIARLDITLQILRTSRNFSALAALGPHVLGVDHIRDMGNCDIIFTCLPGPAELIPLMLDAATGLYTHMKKGATHIELSTIDPTCTTKLRVAAEQAGCNYIQCCQGKTPEFAARAEQQLFIGGPEKLVDELWDTLFTHIGHPVKVSSPEAASTIKLIANMMSGVIVASVAEAILLGEAAGMTAEEVVSLCSLSGCNSHQLQVSGPLMAAKDFRPRFSLALCLKDLSLACDMGHSLGVQIPLAETARELYDNASGHGLSTEDAAAVYKILSENPCN